MAAGFGGVEAAVHADFAQAGVEFERVGGVHAVVAQIGGEEGGRVGLVVVQIMVGRKFFQVASIRRQKLPEPLFPPHGGVLFKPSVFQ